MQVIILKHNVCSAVKSTQCKTLCDSLVLQHNLLIIFMGIFYIINLMNLPSKQFSEKINFFSQPVVSYNDFSFLFCLQPTEFRIDVEIKLINE